MDTKASKKAKRSMWYYAHKRRIQEQQREYRLRKKAKEAEAAKSAEAESAEAGVKKRNGHTQSSSIQAYQTRTNSDCYYHWVGKRVKVQSGWRGQKCAGGGSARNGFAVETAVDWKF